MQINGTTLTPRQAHLVRAALRREQARTLDAMRMLDMTAVNPKARDHIIGAFILTINEIGALIDLTHTDQEGADK
ncbi:hypothetical protein [uncultured Actinomyces sp.]|uniref:hypothetical protein n=1 Tax=uncultured Actinomyces sp. TaxID=249061 RepID=UPI0028E19FD6|nr:hypothetical protein [uncultured Actinomyces sp.]